MCSLKYGDSPNTDDLKHTLQVTRWILKMGMSMLIKLKSSKIIANITPEMFYEKKFIRFGIHNFRIIIILYFIFVLLFKKFTSPIQCFIVSV